MEIYTVGGAVRDELLGLPVKDRDYVVVGATPEDMLARGFKPVGRDFPVFLHPETHEEYALARTERKTAPGYRGFVFHADPGVSLEQDLVRRDLTINAMARSSEGTLVDPHGGQQDLAARVLRHVSDAFAEDPVRILRLARFAARFEAFRVAPETRALCARMVGAGEVDALVPERVWQELARGLMEAWPVRMFEVLDDCGALSALLPELAPCMQREDPFAALVAAARTAQPLAVRWACVWVAPCAGGAAGAREVSERLRAPLECRDLALLAVSEVDAIAGMAGADGETLMGLLERSDAMRRPQRFESLLVVAECARPRAAAGIQACRRALRAASGVDAGALARSSPERSEIPARVRAARVAAVDACRAG